MPAADLEQARHVVRLMVLTAFQCCAKVSGADGKFVPAEAQVLGQLQVLFGLGAADVERLLVLATR